MSSIRLIKLSGTLDIYGVNDVEVDFVRLCTGDNVCVLVDLSKVELHFLDRNSFVDQLRQVTRPPGWEDGTAEPEKACRKCIGIDGYSIDDPDLSKCRYSNFGVTEIKAKRLRVQSRSLFA